MMRRNRTHIGWPRILAITLVALTATVAPLPSWLELFRPELASKPQIVAANKIDALDDPSRVKMLERRAKRLELPFFAISAVTGEGLPPLMEAAWAELAAHGAGRTAEEPQVREDPPDGRKEDAR